MTDSVGIGNSAVLVVGGEVGGIFGICHHFHFLLRTSPTGHRVPLQGLGRWAHGWLITLS